MTGYRWHGGDVIWPNADRIIDALALERIASSAAEGDRRGRLTSNALEAIRRSAYIRAPIPVEFGGIGGGLVECCAAQRKLSAADPGLAIALNMHLFSVFIIVEHWRRARDKAWLLLEAIATQSRIVASAFAEPNLGGSVLRSNSVATLAPGGYRVTGTKVPCSLAAHSDLICFQTELATENRRELLIGLVPSTAPGIRITQSWDALGMRASESDTITFEDCFVPEELVFHRCTPGFDSDPVFASGLAIFCVTATMTYVGLLHAMLRWVRETLERSALPRLETNRSRLPSFQGALGDIVAHTFVLETACLGMAQLLENGTAAPTDLLPIALGVKQAAIDLSTQAVGAAMELAGAQSYAAKSPMARMLRDMQAIRFHPPTRLATRQILGRWALDLPFKFELEERPTES